MKYTHQQKTEILKFLAQYPYEELNFGNEEYCQILKIDYAAQEVTLRDFCEYSVGEILELDGFREPEINNKWKDFINSL